MKKIFLPLCTFVLCHAFADSLELFPFGDIVPSMASQDLLDKYPADKMLYPKWTPDRTLEQRSLMYDIPTNSFWDTLWVSIDNGKVKFMGYNKINRAARKKYTTETKMYKWLLEKNQDNRVSMVKWFCRFFGIRLTGLALSLHERFARQ